MGEQADWVQSQLNSATKRKGKRRIEPITLSPFQRKAVNMLSRAFGTGIYNIPCRWEKVDWDWGYGVRFTIRCGSLSTFDFNHLTRLVVMAHDECIRVSVEPRSFAYLAIVMHQREAREGAMHSRHPTIETAIENFRAPYRATQSDGPKQEDAS